MHSPQVSGVVALLFVAALAGPAAGCADRQAKEGETSTPTRGGGAGSTGASPGPKDQGPEIPNPAAQGCVDQGGTLETVDTPEGQLGVCVFEDGSRCEEWALKRGTCQPGQCRARDGRCS